MAKLKMTIVTEWEVDDLTHYDAKTIEEAAENQQAWIDSGDHMVEDVLGYCKDMTVKIEVVKD